MEIDQRLLGSAIRRVRELRGMSQAKLAEEARLRSNSVALIERGQRGVSIATLNVLADALDVPAACLTMLGTSKFGGLKDSARLVKTLQKLVVALVVAEESLRAKEMGEKAKSKKKPARKKTSRKLEPA